jgi:glycosyltransferase involved in cell wall biosynthesis
MDIAMFTSSLPEPGRKPGGVDVLIVRVANALVDRGHRVRMYSFAPEAEGLNAELITLSPSHIRYARLGRMLLIPALLNFVRFKGDVLHLHGDDWFLIRRRMPTVRTFYGSAREEARTATSAKRRISQRVIYRLELLAARLATTTYSLLPGDGREYGARGALNCGVEIARRPDVARTSHPTVLFVGTWSGRKRGAWLARQFEEHVLPVHPQAELWMVADEVEPAPFIRAIRRPSDEELAGLYRQAWLFCLPSTYEGFGIPYLEAMGAGTPVVASPNPGAHEVLDHGRAGIIADDAALGTKLAALLADYGQRAALTAAGTHRARDFSWDRVTDAYVAAYADAVTRWSSRHASNAS